MSTYCVLNPGLEKDNMNNDLSLCGIKIIMNKSLISIYPDTIIFLIGEIYNIDIWRSNLHLPSDTIAEDVILHLYKTYGIDYTLNVLDGVFSLILFDFCYENMISNIYIVKDAFGITPFYCFTNNKTILFTSSKVMPDTYREHVLYPGSYTIYELGYKVNAEWKVSSIENKYYFVLPNTVIISPVDCYSVSLYHLSKCMKKTILKMCSNTITDKDANDIVKKLFLQIDCSLDEQHDIDIYDNVNKKVIQFSPLHFFVDPTTCESMFDYDCTIRNKLQSTPFESDKKYPFYDKAFVQLYFSIPLHTRYSYHKQLFSMDTINPLL
jgi:hypothetical protein